METNIDRAYCYTPCCTRQMVKRAEESPERFLDRVREAGWQRSSNGHWFCPEHVVLMESAPAQTAMTCSGGGHDGCNRLFLADHNQGRAEFYYLAVKAGWRVNESEHCSWVCPGHRQSNDKASEPYGVQCNDVSCGAYFILDPAGSHFSVAMIAVGWQRRDGHWYCKLHAQPTIQPTQCHGTMCSAEGCTVQHSTTVTMDDLAYDRLLVEDSWTRSSDTTWVCPMHGVDGHPLADSCVQCDIRECGRVVISAWAAVKAGWEIRGDFEDTWRCKVHAYKQERREYERLAVTLSLWCCKPGCGEHEVPGMGETYDSFTRNTIRSGWRPNNADRGWLCPQHTAINPLIPSWVADAASCGNSFRRKSWEPSTRVRHVVNTGFVILVGFEVPKEWKLSGDDAIADDWEIYKEQISPEDARKASDSVQDMWTRRRTQWVVDELNALPDEERTKVRKAFDALRHRADTITVTDLASGGSDRIDAAIRRAQERRTDRVSTDIREGRKDAEETVPRCCRCSQELNNTNSAFGQGICTDCIMIDGATDAEHVAQERRVEDRKQANAPTIFTAFDPTEHVVGMTPQAMGVVRNKRAGDKSICPRCEKSYNVHEEQAVRIHGWCRKCEDEFHRTRNHGQ